MSRKEKPEDQKKKPRTISATDKEWEQLKALAGDGELSSMILDKFKIKRG